MMRRAGILAKDGLVRGRRHHVHLSKDVETASRFGARRGKPVILTGNAGRCTGMGTGSSSPRTACG